MSKNIIAFTGAGISAASGIPTFAEMDGIREKLSRHYADNHPEAFKKVIDELHATCMAAQPNPAHYALAKYNVPILTMNIDQLHQRAGSTDLVELHGRYPNYVLYGDGAPMYQVAYDRIDQMPFQDFTFLIVGTSYYTGISEQLLFEANKCGANVVEINDSAETKVPAFLDEFFKGV